MQKTLQKSNRCWSCLITLKVHSIMRNWNRFCETIETYSSDGFASETGNGGRVYVELFVVIVAEITTKSNIHIFHVKYITVLWWIGLYRKLWARNLFKSGLLLLLLLSWRARQALPIWGGTDVPMRWGIPPDSESGGIRLSLVVVDSHLLTGAPLKGGCSCPQLTIVNHCQTIDVDDVDKLPTL